MTPGNVLEIAKFRLNPGITQEAFVEAVKGTEPIIGAFPGFLSRRIVFAEDGEVYDLVEWESLALAQEAAKHFSGDTHPELVPFMQCLDMAEGFMKHSSIVYSTS